MSNLLSTLTQLLLHTCLAVTTEYPREDPGYWDTRSVIYARAEAVDTTSERFQFDLTFRPFATLTGNVDSARDREFTARAYIAPMGTVLTELPKVGSNYIVLVNKTEKGYVITSANVGGYPGGCAIQWVKDFSDPLVESILDGLRELRARPTKPLDSSTTIDNVKADARRDGTLEKKSKPSPKRH